MLHYEITPDLRVTRAVFTFANGAIQYDDLARVPQNPHLVHAPSSLIEGAWAWVRSDDDIECIECSSAEFSDIWTAALTSGRWVPFWGDRLSNRFAACAAEHRAALVTFVTAGDPDLETCARVMNSLVAGGADIIEIGMPFTDPMADGPAIQAGNIRSLGAGTTLRGVLAMVRAFRTRNADMPLVLMGYFNPILAYGPDAFARDAAAAGLDGCIVVDLPPEEDAELAPALRGHGLHLVRLATPTTDVRRLPAIVTGASGFVYYVAVAGITGANAATADDIGAAVARIKAATDMPVAVGFGIRTPEAAAAVARVADAVVVGSAIVELIGNAAVARANDLPEQVEAFVRDLSLAVRGARVQNAA